MKHFQINNLKSFLEEIETKVVGILYFTSMKNIPCKTVNIEGLPDDCEVTLTGLSIKIRE